MQRGRQVPAQSWWCGYLFQVDVGAAAAAAAVLFPLSVQGLREKDKHHQGPWHPGTPFGVGARVYSQEHDWSCGYLEPGFAPMGLLWNHMYPWPHKDLQSQEQGFDGVCSADITVHSS